MKPASGCCEETLVNFSLLRMPDKLYLNLSDFSLWCTGVVIFAEPYLKSMIGILEKRNEIFSYILGPNLGFFTYIMMSYLYSIWAFVFFSRTVMVQPRVMDLQRDEILTFGYLVLLVGLGMKIYTYLCTSMTTIMGGHYFKLRTALGEATPPSRDLYYHPLGTASVMCYTGFSLIRGSIAGLLLSIILGIANYLAFHFEKFLVQKKQAEKK